MTYQLAGRPAEARQELQRVRNAVEQSGFDPWREGDLPFVWRDWQRLHILLHEAEGLILETRFSRPTRSRGEPFVGWVEIKAIRHNTPSHPTATRE
jgi:hypothetical protein